MTSNTQGDKEEARECLCMVCDQKYPVWYAPNDLWNKVMRAPDGREESEKVPFICLMCFTKEAERQGVKYAAWKLTVKNKEDAFDLKALADQLESMWATSRKYSDGWMHMAGLVSEWHQQTLERERLEAQTQLLEKLIRMSEVIGVGYAVVREEHIRAELSALTNKDKDSKDTPDHE